MKNALLFFFAGLSAWLLLWVERTSGNTQMRVHVPIIILYINIVIRLSTYQPLPTARMGIVTVDAVSEDPSMWHRPSKIPPGSITMHGE